MDNSSGVLVMEKKGLPIAQVGISAELSRRHMPNSSGRTDNVSIDLPFVSELRCTYGGLTVGS